MNFLRTYNLYQLAEFARKRILAARMEERRRLESWKEIALYLKRSTGTCRRWETELDLPVHRLDGTPKAHVFAYTEEIDRWLAEKLHVVDALTKEVILSERRKKNRVLISAGVVIGLLVLALLVWRFYPFPVAAPSHIPSLAVLPFENVTGDESLETWRTSFPVLISTDLEQSKFVNAVPTIPLYSRLKELELTEAKKFSPEDLKKVADKAEADYLVTGSLIKTGEDIFITVFVEKPGSGEVAKSLRAHCRGEKCFFAAADDFTKEIKLGMNLTPRHVARDYDKPVSKISTDSPEAFKLYSQELRLAVWREKSQQEIFWLNKAVELDPEFALAYERLTFKYAQAKRKEESKKYSQKAQELSDRMSERHYLLFLAGHNTYFFGEKDYDKALKASEKLWSRYPVLFSRDVYGQWNLLDLYMELEEYDKAIGILEKLGPRYRKDSYIVQMLVECYEFTGLYEKAKKIIDDYATALPSESGCWLYWYRELAFRQKKYDEALKYLDMAVGEAQRRDDFGYASTRGLILWKQDDFVRAGEEYRKVFNKDDPGEQAERAINLAVLAFSQGKAEEAKSIIKQALELSRRVEYLWKARGFEMSYFLAYLHVITGQLPEALKVAEEACRDFGQKGQDALQVLYLKAWITLEMNKFDEFEKQAEEIKEVIRKGQLPQFMRDYYQLLGLRELKKNNIDAAIGYFGKAMDLFKVPYAGIWAPLYYSWAEAFYRANLRLKALEMYSKLAEPWVVRSFFGDLYAKSFYMKAKIYEKNASPGIWGVSVYIDGNDKANAIENYRKFLSLWGNADPIFPEVEDARKSLAKLESTK